MTLYVRTTSLYPKWTYEALFLGEWQPITKEELNRHLRSGGVVHWNPRLNPAALGSKEVA